MGKGIINAVGTVGRLIEVGEVVSGDVLYVNGKRYMVGEWVVGDGYSLTGIEHLYENNEIES